MKNVVNIPDIEEIREQAGTWVIRLQEGLTPSQKSELAEWLAERNRHQKALVEMATLWDEMGLLEELSEVYPLESPPVEASPRFSRRIAIAASVLLMAGLGWFAVGLLGESNNTIVTSPVDVRPTDIRYESGIGEQSIVHLADGTTATLNTNTLVSVDFSDTERKIVLLRGEAHFSVAHDRARPFVVRAGQTSVRAIGTAFNVYLAGLNRVEVAVHEGIVAVQPADGTVLGQEGAEARLTAGQFASVSGSVAEVTTLTDAEVRNQLAWQTGRVIFEDEPLANALREFQRYTPVSLVVEDPAVADIRVAGYFEVGNIDALVESLRQNFDIVARSDGPERIILETSSAR